MWAEGPFRPTEERSVERPRRCSSSKKWAVQCFGIRLHYRHRVEHDDYCQLGVRTTDSSGSTCICSMRKHWRRRSWWAAVRLWHWLQCFCRLSNVRPGQAPVSRISPRRSTAAVSNWLSHRFRILWKCSDRVSKRFLVGWVSRSLWSWEKISGV